MLERIIIADASCLIALTNIDELEVLQKVYEEITITPEVKEEYGDSLPDWIVIEEVLEKEKIALLELQLDKGESSAIALALEKENSLLLIDERKGRAIAKRMGVAITGILGVIIKAKEIGVVEKVKPFIEKLESVEFRISERLKSQILKKVKE
ncbi:MAG: DUF3368 domain-containing protein [Chitinophagales bacterium]